MSTTVSYKGNTIATLSNETKTLNTAGTWVEDNIEIRDARLHTATITTAGFYDSRSGMCSYVRYNNNKYYNLNTEITFYEGDILEIIGVHYDSGYVMTLYVDGNEVEVQASGNVGHSYNYISSNCDITIDLSSSRGNQTVYINTVATTLNLQSKTATPTESTQTITPDTGYDGLSSVEVGAISSSYIGSGIDRKSSTDLTVSGAAVTSPAGYYAESASKSVASGTAGTPSATKGTVSGHSISITPSVTNTTGYITGGTKTGTAVTVTASELASGNKEITSNGTDIDVIGYSTVSVDVSSLAVILSDNLHDSSKDVPNTYISGSTETTYNGWTSTGYIPVKPNTVYRLKNTPGNMYNAFYKTDKSSEKGSVQVPYSGNNSDAYVFIKTTSNTAYIRMSGASAGVANYEIYEVKTGFPTGTIDITSNGNYNVSEYETANVNISSQTPNLQAKTGIAPTTSSQTITADSGYDGLSSVQINAMPSGSTTTPATTITANPSITVSSSGLITATTSASQSVTPTVSAGYVSSGTAGTITASGSKTQQLTTKGATTITPTKSSQTAVASGVYTTGAITVAAIPSNYITTTDATASASDILSGETAYVNGSKVTGTLTFSTVTVSSSNPTGGANGDVWIKTS